jgi:DNA helicase-2/ATP-dependent DNA helicase PcrA
MNSTFTPEEGHPTPFQKEAYLSDSESILAIAGPGSGKTRTLIWRIKRLLHDGVLPEELAAITFTNAAADEIKGRLGTSVNLHYVGTLHGFMLRILQQYGNLIGYHSKLTVLDEAGADEFLKEQIAASNYKASKKSIEEAITKGPPKLASTPELMFVWNYFQQMKRAGLITYDGILCLGAELMKKHGHQINMAPLRYLFIDEYQDSGVWDHFIYKSIPIRNLFFVGDPDQSIYSFRGGNLQNILDLAENPHTHVIRMQQNFRSGTEICEAAQRLIEHNKMRVDKMTISALDFDGRITVTPCKDLTEEFATISLYLHTAELEPWEPGEQIHSPGGGSYTTERPPRTQSANLEECAILLTTNDLVAQYKEHFRKQFPIKETRYDALPPDWSKCVLLISVLADPRNDYNAKKWLEVKEGRSVANSAALRASKERVPINSVFMHFPNDLPAEKLEGQLAAGGIKLESIQLVRTLVNKSGPNASVSDILFAIRCGGYIQEDTGSGLTITTIHKAKGREWDTVIIPACEHHLIPGQRKTATPEDIEEQRRLFYVAITRARRELIITHSKKRVRPWGPPFPEPSEPSPFIAEIQPS